MLSIVTVIEKTLKEKCRDNTKHHQEIS